MDKIKNSVFRNMTIADVEYMLEAWSQANVEFWDLVDLYYIGD